MKRGHINVQQAFNPWSPSEAWDGMTLPRCMTPRQELELAIAATLDPEIFKDMGHAFGWVPKSRARRIRQAQRVLRIIEMFGGQIP